MSHIHESFWDIASFSGRRQRSNISRVGLFCGNIWFFCRNTGQFCRTIGLFLRHGLSSPSKTEQGDLKSKAFWREIWLFCGTTGLFWDITPFCCRGQISCRRRRSSISRIGLFCGHVELICGNIGLFCRNVVFICGNTGLFCRNVGFIWGNIGLFARL